MSAASSKLTRYYNTQVKRGQTCAKIDPRPYQNIVDETRANLAVANAQLHAVNVASTRGILAGA
jgi:HlyD family secretion protein